MNSPRERTRANRPVILLDCDGPLADFTGAYLRALTKETGRVHSPSEVDRWKIADCSFFASAAEHVGLSVTTLRRYVDDHVTMPGFCEDIAVQPGAREAVDRLRELGEVFVVTSPWDSSRTWMYERLHWCAKHFDLPRGNIIQTGRKHLIRGDVFVDDKLSHVEEWAGEWPRGRAFLFDMDHNRGESAARFRGGWEHAIAAAEHFAVHGGAQ